MELSEFIEDLHEMKVQEDKALIKMEYKDEVVVLDAQEALMFLEQISDIASALSLAVREALY